MLRVDARDAVPVVVRVDSIWRKREYSILQEIALESQGQGRVWGKDSFTGSWYVDIEDGLSIDLL